MSINQCVIYLLRIAAGLGRTAGKRRTFHDLDLLSGTWSPSQAEEFQQALAGQRGVDQALWK